MRLRHLLVSAGIASLLVQSPGQAAEPAMEVHEDYYRGFAQGAYYGLMLAGEDYHLAWCMKVELEHAARGMGTGAEFQRTMEALLDRCREDTGSGG